MQDSRTPAAPTDPSSFPAIAPRPVAADDYQLSELRCVKQLTSRVIPDHRATNDDIGILLLAGGESLREDFGRPSL